MTVKEEWIGSKKPATQANLADLQEDTHAELDKTEQRIKKEIRAEIRASEKRLDSRIGKVERIVESILKVVQSIDGHFKLHRHLPEEVDKLKARVFKLELRR